MANSVVAVLIAGAEEPREIVHPGCFVRDRGARYDVFRVSNRELVASYLKDAVMMIEQRA